VGQNTLRRHVKQGGIALESRSLGKRRLWLLGSEALEQLRARLVEKGVIAVEAPRSNTRGRRR
jgi:hypothetical protein